MRIDGEAPVVAHATVEIDAPPHVAWDVIADFERWPTWNADVTSVSVSGPVAPGTEFTWKAGMSIRSRLEAVERPNLLAWSGRTFGIRAIHVWTFSEKDGKTLASSAESWNGPLPRLLPAPLRKQLRNSLEAAMPRFRLEVERRAGDQPA